MHLFLPAAPTRRLTGESSSRFSPFPAILVLLAGLLAVSLHGQATYVAVNDPWISPSAWSTGMVPDASTTVLINQSAYIDLPLQAFARSLTIVDGGNTGNQLIRFYYGNLELTPAASASLTVGAASPLAGQARSTDFGLAGSTLTSTGFASIGKSQLAGAGSTLSATMQLGIDSAWIHSAGLIEVGGGGGTGVLRIAGNSIVAGSFLSGVGQDPRLIISGPESLVRIDGGVGRFEEVDVNSFYRSNGGAALVLAGGSFETKRLRVGESTAGAVNLATGFSEVGDLSINRGSEMTVGGMAHAASVDVNDGLLFVEGGNLTVGIPSPIGSFSPVFRVGADAGSVGRAILGSGGDLAVNGKGIVGDLGTGTLTVGGTATFTGDLVVGDGTFAGQGTGHVNVGAGSRLIAQNMYVGTSQDEMFGSVQLYPVGTGTLHVDDGGVVEIAGLDTGFVFQPGKLFVGSGARLSGDGLVEFSRPDGSTSIDIGTIVNVGVISPGNSPGLLTVDGNLVFKIPFGFSPQGGTLEIELGGLTGGVDYDVLHVMGNVDLTGGILDLSLWGGFTPGDGDIFNFLIVDGLLTGQFASLVDHTGLGLTLDDIIYGEHGVSFSRRVTASVPDAAPTVLLLGLAVAELVGIRRRPASH